MNQSAFKCRFALPSLLALMVCATPVWSEEKPKPATNGETLEASKNAPEAEATTPESKHNGSQNITTEKAFPAELLTPYRAQYEFYLGSKHVGSATRHLVIGNKGRYALNFDSEGSYLLMSYTARQRSTFQIHEGIVQPLHFSLYQKRPFKSAETQEIHFEWGSPTTIKTEYDGKQSEETLKGIGFDSLTHMLQLRADLIQRKAIRGYPVTRKGETKTYEYKILGYANLSMYGNEYETLKIERVRDDNKRETFTWLDKSNGYFPVRILQKKDGEVQFDIRLREFKLDKQAESAKIKEM